MQICQFTGACEKLADTSSHILCGRGCLGRNPAKYSDSIPISSGLSSLRIRCNFDVALISFSLYEVCVESETAQPTPCGLMVRLLTWSSPSVVGLEYVGEIL